ncbi:MAG: hypothetical protein QOC81_2921 [Thermoanaerobaculia bacterium]|jgi:hypothetical protein|nr:hypothetical protein [Thermoanaerobaculia bacterium]
MATTADAIEKRILAMHPLDFEELCAELVTELGFINVRRQGSGTQFGRDIAADFAARRAEPWFFECKRYSRPIPLKEISNKLLWADAQDRLDYFVIVSNADVSNDFQQLIDLPSRRRYKILTWTGSTFRRLLATCPRTVGAWFTGKQIEPPLSAIEFISEQRGNVERHGGTSSDVTGGVTITIKRSMRTPADNPCYAVITDYDGNVLAKVTLKRNAKIQVTLPKEALGKPVRILYDFEPHACLGRHYPDTENVLLTSELSLPSEHLKTRMKAVMRVPMDEWRQYTGTFYRGAE